MGRALHVISVGVLLAGCQAQNPFAAFGPPTIPSPNTTQALPYYPPSGAAALSTAKTPAASARLSVSVTPGSAPANVATLTPEPADREPIRIVEDASAATRTAAARRSPASNGSSNPPAASAPPLPPAKTGNPQSRAARRDAAVVPAAYEQSSPAFREAAPASGQWRAR